MISYKNDILCIEDVKLSAIASKFSTPTYVYSKNQIIQNFKSYLNYLPPNKGLICFAVKTNSNESILKILSKLGAGADTTSGGEIYRCLKSGFKPAKIVYAGVGKTAEEIEYALNSRILMFNVESFEELAAIDKIAGRLKTKAQIAFRINPNVDPHTHSYIVTGKKGTKFGIPYEQTLKAYAAAAKCKNIIPAGIHYHIGSQILETKPFYLAAAKIQKLVVEIEKMGIELPYINGGGGLGIEYEQNEKAPKPQDLIDNMFKLFGAKKIIFEPGRSIIGNAGALLTKVIYRKQSGGKNFLIVDAAMTDLLRPSLYDAYHNIVPVKKTSDKKFKTDVVGPVCESGDFMGKDRMLPLIEQGGYLLIECAGAYGAAMSSQYNLRPLIAQVLVDKNKTTLIRKRDQYKDLR